MTSGEISGHRYVLMEPMGHLMVTHQGDISWDMLQTIKNKVWGVSAVAIEVYPPQDMVVNSLNMRHLWRLGNGEFWPDMMGSWTRNPGSADDSLEQRFDAAWAETRLMWQRRGVA